jgi:hypothetical protein
MTTRRAAEAVLFDGEKLTANLQQGKRRRRVDAIYYPICAGWVEVRLQPVRLHCTVCGLEARP